MRFGKKLIVFYEFMFALGLICISAGLSFMVRSNLGISVASSMPYVISHRFGAITFGTWSYIVQGFLVLLLIIIVRKIKISYVLSFLVSVVFGYLLDFFTGATAALPVDHIWLRFVYYAVGLFVLSFGIASVVFSQWPPIPFDLFVKELALHKNLSFKKTKTGFDLSCLAFSSVFLIIFIRQITGIGPGTIISALFNGTLVSLWLKLFSGVFLPRYLLRKSWTWKVKTENKDKHPETPDVPAQLSLRQAEAIAKSNHTHLNQ